MSNKKHFVFKLSPTSFRVMEEQLEAKQQLLVSNIFSAKANSLSHDTVKDILFYTDYNNGVKLNYLKLSDLSYGLVTGFTAPEYDPANAAYHDGAIWYFTHNTNELVKLTLSYDVNNIPSISNRTTYSISGMDLPATGTVGINTNSFGDIAINNNSGILYACTSRGRIYSIDLSDPVNTFTEILESPGNDNSVGLQLAYNNSSNILYGHNHKSGNWFTINTTNGSRTTLNIATSFMRDLAGSSTTMYGSTIDSIYRIDLNTVTPTALNNFFLPKGDDTTTVQSFNVSLQNEGSDESFRIGIINPTSSPNIVIDWGDNTKSNILNSDTVEHTYDQIGSYSIKINGYGGDGILKIGGNIKPIWNGTYWVNDYSQNEFVKSVNVVDGLSGISSLQFSNLINLSGVPEDLFDSIETEITSLNSSFKDTGLVSIPSGLLTSLNNVTDYISTFEDCDNISGVPIPFFPVHASITSMDKFLNNTVINNYNEFLDWLYTEADSINLTNIVLGACGNEANTPSGLAAFSGLLNLGWTINDNTPGNNNSNCIFPTPTATTVVPTPTATTVVPTPTPSATTFSPPPTATLIVSTPTAT